MLHQSHVKLFKEDVSCTAFILNMNFKKTRNSPSYILNLAPNTHFTNSL